MEVFDVSNNTYINGAIPDSYSALTMLFAAGTSLSDASLPSYVEVAATSAGDENDNNYHYYYELIHDLLVCSSLSSVPGREGQSVVAITVDPAYDEYSVCACGDG